MSLAKLLRLRRDPEARPSMPRRPGPAAMPPPPSPEVIRIDARELAEAWSPTGQRLALRSVTPMVKGQRVTVVVSGAGGATIPLAGAVMGAAPAGGGCAVEIGVDEERRPALRRIMAFLEGVAREPTTRAPRLRLALPAFVASRETHAYMTTFSVSRGGCGLVWSGTPPKRGGALQIRLGSGTRSASFQARVCWTRQEQNGLRVGVRFLVGEDSSLAALIDQEGRGAAAT